MDLCANLKTVQTSNRQAEVNNFLRNIEIFRDGFENSVNKQTDMMVIKLS